MLAISRPGSLAGQPHTWAALNRLAVAQKYDACRFEGSLHLLHATQAGVLAILESVDRIDAHGGHLGQLLGAPFQAGAGHSALFWVHVVKISPKMVDIKQVMLLSLMVRLSPLGAAQYADRQF